MLMLWLLQYSLICARFESVVFEKNSKMLGRTKGMEENDYTFRIADDANDRDGNTYVENTTHIHRHSPVAHCDVCTFERA